ncbi:hypothetical protein LTR85_002097 [Meristemomyces frigidus]|nr:hypothetical protein LTR85_002097 [Meristemomyces frigidus]
MERYPGLRKLFVDFLDVKDADATSIIDELCGVNGAVEQIDAIKTLLLALSGCPFSNASERTALQPLLKADMEIFPIRDEDDTLRLVALREKCWFIPDLTSLQNAFMGKVAMPDLRTKELATMRPLLDTLGLQDRLLSKHVNEETDAEGELVFQTTLTDSLRAKARYIAPLVDDAGRDEALKQLTTVEVLSAAKILLRSNIRTSTRRVYGTDKASSLVLRKFDGRLQALVPQAEIARDAMPHGPLCDRLMETFGIHSDQQVLLLKMLIIDDGAAINDMLERTGFLPGAFTESNLAHPDSEDAADNDSLGDGLDRDMTTSHKTEVVQSSESAISNGVEPSLLPDRDTSGRRQPVTRPNGRVDGRRILAAASSVETNAIRVVGSTTTPRTRRNYLETSGANGAPSNKAIPCDGGNGPTLSGSFDMASVRSALNASTSQSLRPSAGLPVGNIMVNDATLPDSTSGGQAEEWQRDNGYGGELFVFGLLKEKFHAEDDCWTSGDRSRAGLPPFLPFEGDYVDFTISDTKVCQRITDWLGDLGSGVSLGVDGSITYHIEVKSTVGRSGEPFSMSNNRVDLAQKWHNSPNDVCIIFRVYDLLSSAPQVQAYVDPFALMLDRRMSFTAQGGYFVQAA